MREIMNKKGVTLIELLVVLVLVSIVTTIGFVTFSNIIANAEKDILLSDAATIKGQFERCEEEEGGTACLGYLKEAEGKIEIDFNGVRIKLSRDVVITNVNTGSSTVTLMYGEEFTLEFEVDSSDHLTRDDVK